MQPTDERFIKRTLDLALRGLGKVRPNPLVGCVIVKDDTIIGEGWHQVFGGPHAEVNAVKSVNKKELLKGSTVYINLEPCSFHGKTPPCAHMLADLEIGRVVISNIDPNPKVNGSGLELLRQRGIEVITDALKDDGWELNKRFFTYYEKKRPYIILKWAQTADGFIARENYDSKWISNEFSRKMVHKWRGEEHAILIGRNTAHHDNPSLTTRDWHGSNPVRVVIDNQLILDPKLALFDRSTPTICYNNIKSEELENLSFVIPGGDEFPESVLNDLYQRNIQSVLIEGGSRLLQSFIDKGIWDEARVFTSDKVFGKGIKAPGLKGIPADRKEFRNDVLTLYTPFSNG
ncbi:MAG: bifunctional diaminohydroxyphosphoribosylaminopyrimidine deaminase/5-amino-6-(5-phosphoribosylamino)uracil reductase RibD [Cyclobacteriaceae bacterium]|nr:bifunctional diaminohydroxyphosphoribosylaminopyrimidine deaminase/5-amino-6-(5-phosphoribosylamino)uracil reductase RibD [Cyclobacteriaceae bacterium]